MTSGIPRQLEAYVFERACMCVRACVRAHTLTHTHAHTPHSAQLGVRGGDTLGKWWVTRGKEERGWRQLGHGVGGIRTPGKGRDPKHGEGRQDRLMVKGAPRGPGALPGHWVGTGSEAWCPSPPWTTGSRKRHPPPPVWTGLQHRRPPLPLLSVGP